MKIRITPATVLLLLMQAFEGKVLLPAGLLAALFHECGHLLAAHALGVKIKQMEIDLLGAKLYPKGMLPSYHAELLLAAAGPLFSLLLGIFLLPHDGAFAVAVRDATFSFALFNLLPIKDFDGGRILLSLLAQRTTLKAAERALCVTSYLSLLLLFLLSSCVLLCYGQNLALTVLTASLFAKLFLTQS